MAEMDGAFGVSKQLSPCHMCWICAFGVSKRLVQPWSDVWDLCFWCEQAAQPLSYVLDLCIWCEQAARSALVRCLGYVLLV